MARTAESLWNKYYQNKPKPKDNIVTDSILLLTRFHCSMPVLKIFLIHFETRFLNLKKFIIEKDLFAFDTTYPIVVRLMPEYERGFAIASAEFTPPYQKKGDTYYNIDDITKYPKRKTRKHVEGNE